MVEESESLDAENVIDYSQMLAEELGDGIHVGCLHGKMKQKEKDEIMSAFGKNEIQILVAGAACVDCERRTLAKSTKQCRIIVHQRLPVRR